MADAKSDAMYWRTAYEELVRQTGRDLNDGFGVDPRRTHAHPLAASPQAPAREGVRIAELEFELSAKIHTLEIADEQIERLQARIEALTPREEAPDWTAATQAAWDANNHASEEAPAEGAGELADRVIALGYTNTAEYALATAYNNLRARTSEPEAVAWWCERPDGTGFPMATDPGEWPNLTVHRLFKEPPAPATADKLREILRAHPSIRLHAALKKLATLSPKEEGGE